ncbi:MAG: hypothetical protein NC293_08800 [Roseburia sp.]|nr:hypothetical protein [Roseburia sp.]
MVIGKALPRKAALGECHLVRLTRKKGEERVPADLIANRRSIRLPEPLSFSHFLIVAFIASPVDSSVISHSDY